MSENLLYRPQRQARVAVKVEGVDDTDKRPFKQTQKNESIITLDDNIFFEPNLLQKLHLQRKPEANQIKISRQHGRDTSDERISNKVVWEDRYGIVYGDRNTKGGNMANIEVRTIEEPGYLELRVQGLKDSIGLENIDKVSGFMRKNGLPTERVASVRQLKEVYSEGKKIPISEWKAKVVEKKEEEIINIKTASVIDQRREELEKIRLYLASTEFYVVERDLQVAERLRDLGSDVNTEKQLHRMLGPVFNWINVVFKVKHEGIIPGTKPSEPFTLDKAGIERYLNWLPTQMGIYLARLHKLGGVHGYAHSQNWSLAGTLYDLDSVKIAGLTDNDLGEQNLEVSQNDDVVNTIYAISDETLYSTLLQKMFPDLHNSTVGVFVKSYITERFGNNLTENEIEEIFTKYFSNNATPSLFSQALPRSVLDSVKESFAKK